MNDSNLYFAFGSNLHPPQMAERCPGSMVVQPACLEGYQLAFSGFSKRWGGGVATIVATPGKQVHGVLYRLSAVDWEYLNRFEGFPTIYSHLPVEVLGADKRMHPAITYQKCDFAPSAPSLTYFHQIWRAHKAFQLNETPLLEALENGLAAVGNGNSGGGG